MSDELLKQILEKLNKIDNDIQELKADNPLIKQAVLETAETVKRIESNQERHERILEILSVRSIEQEADIKRLK
jgi:archaellum component FlaC